MIVSKLSPGKLLKFLFVTALLFSGSAATVIKKPTREEGQTAFDSLGDSADLCADYYSAIFACNRLHNQEEFFRLENLSLTAANPAETAEMKTTCDNKQMFFNRMNKDTQASCKTYISSIAPEEDELTLGVNGTTITRSFKVEL